MYTITNTICTPTFTNAPIPTALAVFGLSSFHINQRIRPTIGTKNPKTPQRNPPSSIACTAPSSLVDTPHSKHTAWFSFTSFPQFLHDRD